MNSEKIMVVEDEWVVADQLCRESGRYRVQDLLNGIRGRRGHQESGSG